MSYFVTGATGFIGKFFIEKLLQREGTIYVLVRPESTAKFEDLQARYPGAGDRLQPVYGDLTQPQLGLSDQDKSKLTGNIKHFFHIAAVYDMAADAESQEAANVDGTRNAVQCAEAIQAGCFQHVSSVAVSGLFKGTFREDMFDEAENLDHPYFRTKHESEAVVRAECSIPYRVYRPGAVVGHSETGEIDKVDGPYYMFGLLKKLRELLPPWMPLMGLESGLMNIVPVDYVTASMDYIAHQPDLDGEAFHLTNPDSYTMPEVINIFAEAGHAPKFAMRVDKKIFSFVPSGLFGTIGKLPPVKRLKQAVFQAIGLPEAASVFMDYDTRYDSRDAQKVLQGSGIECPRLPGYAAKIWDYWERNLDPDLLIDRSLAGNVAGKVVVVTGGSSGIGEAIAHMVAEAGAKVIITARTQDKLDVVVDAIRANGGEAYAYTCDISDLESCDAMVQNVIKDHGGCDILISNAGRSIRRSINLAYDRFHDFERTMQLNYFGALRIILGFLPGMSERKGGQVIHVSSIGVLGNSPRFSAYVASKSALDSFMRCAGAEFAHDKIDFTTINMPLVKTPMIAPTKIYEYAPTLTVEESMDLVVDAIVNKPRRVANSMGKFLSIANAIAPKLMEVVWNISYRMFPDSDAAQGKKESGKVEPSNEQVALAQIMQGIHF